MERISEIREMNGISIVCWVLAGITWAIGFVCNTIIAAMYFNKLGQPDHGVYVAGVACSTIAPIVFIIGWLVVGMLRDPSPNVHVLEMANRAQPIRRYYSRITRARLHESDRSDEEFD